MQQTHTLAPLIPLLAQAHQQQRPATSDGWGVYAVTQGMNGIIYKAESDHTGQPALALKISQRDERQRAYREYEAMSALWQVGISDVCPQPLALYTQDDLPPSVPGDVVVMTWVSGQALTCAPADNERLWQAIINAFVRVHSLTDKHPGITLRPAVIPVNHPGDLLHTLQERYRRLDDAPDEIGGLTRNQLHSMMWAIHDQIPALWHTAPPRALSLHDANCNNMIVRDNHVTLVDWANSGWCDPAFDMAEMLAQPKYQHLPEDRREWIRDTYAERTGDDHAYTRIRLYEWLMRVFWVLKFSSVIAQTEPTKTLIKPNSNPTEAIRQQLHYWQLVKRDFNIS